LHFSLLFFLPPPPAANYRLMLSSILPERTRLSRSPIPCTLHSQRGFLGQKKQRVHVYLLLNCSFWQSSWKCKGRRQLHDGDRDFCNKTVWLPWPEQPPSLVLKEKRTFIFFYLWRNK
jgi:hypothetical protein